MERWHGIWNGSLGDMRGNFSRKRWSFVFLFFMFVSKCLSPIFRCSWPSTLNLWLIACWCRWTIPRFFTARTPLTGWRWFLYKGRPTSSRKEWLNIRKLASWPPWIRWTRQMCRSRKSTMFFEAWDEVLVELFDPILALKDVSWLVWTKTSCQFLRVHCKGGAGAKVWMRISDVFWPKLHGEALRDVGDRGFSWI